MEPPSDSRSRPAAGAPAQRACDECRTRKTRCDRASPCSHCRAFALTCRTTTQRSKVPQERVHVTKKYEGKLDLIDSRLAHIEKLLEESRGHAPSSPESGPRPRPLSPISNGSWNYSSRASYLDHASASSTPAGDTGPRAESMAAKNVLEQTVDCDPDPAVHQDSELRAALEALRRIVHRAQLDAIGVQRCSLLTASTSPETPAPTWTQVEAVLERLAISKPASFNWLSPALLNDFRQKCRSMYQRGQEGSPTDKLLVYSIMANTCMELSGTDAGGTADYYHSLSRSFFNLLLEGLATFPLLMPASLDAAEALMVAASTTVAMCRPSLTWLLSGATARMCQFLGYNRLSRLNPKSDPLFQRKVVLFWSVYILDRSNALRLGRSPAIQDSDIDTPMLSDEHSPELVALVKFWVESGRMQGRICTQLYGPSALSLPPDERAAIAETFARELDQIHQRRLKTNASMFSPRANTAAANLLISGESVRHYGSLTMALYAIPLNHPRSFLALETARKCLSVSREISKNHLKCNNVYAWTTYCHWVLLDAPLTPFTGIFCNIVAHPESSQEDMQLLEDFVTSLQPAVPLSEGVEKFHQLCAIFVSVARAYVRAKTQQPCTNGQLRDTYSSTAVQPAIGEFDEHLAALGFLGPQHVTPLHNINSNHNSGASFRDVVNGSVSEPLATPSLLDWQSGNVSLYGLLEQDLNDIAFGSFGERPNNT